jgi:hypothetical protein
MGVASAAPRSARESSVTWIAAGLSCIALVAAPALTAGPERPEAAAEAAARTWLARVGAGQYAQSGGAAAAAFRSAMPAARRQLAAAGVRSPLGALTPRTLRSATDARSVPGAPERETVIVQFAPSFEHNPDAVETATPVKEPDGTWRVSGYYVR